MRKILGAMLLSGLLAACGQNGDTASDDTRATDTAAPAATAQDEAQMPDGLVLPAGFKATVVHPGVGFARHLAVRDNGDIYVMTRLPPFGPKDKSKTPGIVALRDTNGDHVADVVKSFGDILGTGIGFHNGDLYVSDETHIYRFDMAGVDLVPTKAPEVVISGFMKQREHAEKPFAFDEHGNIYVNVGSPSNICQQQTGRPGSPGQMPCTQRDRQAGIWRFNADETGQTQVKDGEHYAIGLRNSIAIRWNTAANGLYVIMHDRDMLNNLWPDLYSVHDNAIRPADEMHLLVDGGDYGWPYTYYDVIDKKRVIGPEYGGDGKKTPEPGKYIDPDYAFAAHSAPDDIVFYSGKEFPPEFQGGAFIALHGGWNRAPEPQVGYKVVFIPMKDGKVAGDMRDFATNFARIDLSKHSAADAVYRPVGLAVGPDGALYISDSEKGRIWRIDYEG